MSLSFRVVALNEEPLSVPLIGHFDERGGQIGRSDNVTFTLPDPERMISRVQANILHRDEAYWLENVSAANPILHNGRPLSSGMTVALKGGDEVRIGGYRMIVDFESDETSVTILRGRTQPARKYLDSQADLPIEASPPMTSGPVVPSFPAPRQVLGHLASPTPIAAPPTLTAMPAAAPAEMLPAARPAAGDPISAEALWRGFQEGAGVALPLPNGPSPELFSAIGAMMKIAIEGIHRLVAMRTLVKSGMQAEMTMIQARGNNPLKFSPDPSVALERLLQPPERGYLAGPSALRDALIDLQSHQIGVMTGMSAALAAVLDRFDPVHLETRLSARSVFDSLVPAHRRSRLWELYLEHFRSLKEEAQEDFNRLFNDAFREAYEEQVRILEQSVAQDAPARGKPR